MSTQADTAKPSLGRKLIWPASAVAARMIARIAWGLRVDPGEGFPPPPFVVASNHHSFLDPPLVGAVYGRRVRFLSVSELAGHHKWLDLALDLYETVPVPRGRVPLGAIRSSLAHLESGGVLGVFPEGARYSSFDPERVKHGAAWLAVRTGVPLVAVAIRGTDRVLGPDNRLHMGKIGVVVGPSLHPAGSGRDAVVDLSNRWTDWMIASGTGVG